VAGSSSFTMPMNSPVARGPVPTSGPSQWQQMYDDLLKLIQAQPLPDPQTDLWQQLQHQQAEQREAWETALQPRRNPSRMFNLYGY